MAIPSTTQRVRGAPAPRQLPVAVDWGLAYESLIGLALFIGGEDEHSYEVGPGWFKKVRQTASRALVEAGRSLFANEGFALTGLAGLAHEAGGRSTSALIERLETDDGSAKWAMLHADPPLRRAIETGESKAVDAYLKQHHGSKASRAAAIRLIEADGRKVVRETAGLLQRWEEEIFSQLGPPLEADLKASAQSVSRLARQLPPDRLIIKATQGVEYRPEPWIESVILVPTVLNRPWVDITEYGSIKFFFYPASRESASPDVQLVEVYKALGDETRLRILRLLAGGESTLTDIANKLGLAKSTVHGHMRILRAAGLTRSIVGDEGKGYALNDRPDLNSLLDAYLKV